MFHEACEMEVTYWGISGGIVGLPKECFGRPAGHVNSVVGLIRAVDVVGPVAEGLRHSID